MKALCLPTYFAYVYHSDPPIIRYFKLASWKPRGSAIWVLLVQDPELFTHQSCFSSLCKSPTGATGTACKKLYAVQFQTSNWSIFDSQTWCIKTWQLPGLPRHCNKLAYFFALTTWSQRKEIPPYCLRLAQFHLLNRPLTTWTRSGLTDC